MELIILGSGTCVPSLTRGGPSQLLRAGKSNILIDSGTGTMRSLLKSGFNYNDISLLLYTHTHPDHTAELVSFLFACQYAEIPRTHPLTIAGGDGFKSFFQKLENVYGRWIQPKLFDLKVEEHFNSRFEQAGVRVSTKKTAHIRDSIGIRFEYEGKSVVVSGDTEYCANIVSLSKNSDLLVIECSHPDGHEAIGHLTPSDVARIVSEAGCKRVVMSHFYPGVERCNPEKLVREKTMVKVSAAVDLMRIQV